MERVVYAFESERVEVAMLSLRQEQLSNQHCDNGDL